jgi:hypothetical protein
MRQAPQFVLDGLDHVVDVILRCCARPAGQPPDLGLGDRIGVPHEPTVAKSGNGFEVGHVSMVHRDAPAGKTDCSQSYVRS